MARGINKVILVGNLGQDPEVRYLPSGGAVTSGSVATTDSWKDKQTGQLQERTEWHRVVFFNRLAEIAGEYLKKGAQVYIEGRLQTRKWQDQSGSDRYTTEIVANEMQMLGGRQQNTMMGGDPGYASNQSASGAMAPNPAAPSPAAANSVAPNYSSTAQPTTQNAPNRTAPTPAPAPAMDQFDDDIPF